MATIETHCQDCIEVFGEDFKYVHKWLDEYAKKYNQFTYLEYHRKFRHHNKGVEEVIEKWGYYAGQAAKLHIIRDYEVYLLTPLMDVIREDQIDKLYKQILPYCHKGE